jgi:hypothetical protein
MGSQKRYLKVKVQSFYFILSYACLLQHKLFYFLLYMHQIVQLYKNMWQEKIF